MFPVVVFQALPDSDLGEQRHMCVARVEGGECFPFKSWNKGSEA